MAQSSFVVMASLAEIGHVVTRMPAAVGKFDVFVTLSSLSWLSDDGRRLCGADLDDEFDISRQ